jgi:PAS domain S-box-containing protein
MSKKLSATVNNTETPTISCEIVNRVKDALFALDTNWNITYMNEAAGEYFNNNTETLLGKNFWQIFPERKIVFFDKYYDKALKNQEIIIAEEYSSLKNNWFEKRIYPSLTGLTIIIKDINEKKTADEKEKGIARKISELNTKFTKVFHENPIPLSLRDKNRMK